MKTKINAFARSCETERFIKETLAALVAIPSVSRDCPPPRIYGEETARALDTALALGASLGFETENHGYACGSILLRGGKEEIGILAHLDVVPAGDGWINPPFELTETGGVYVGRGVQDDKGPAVAALAAMKFFKENGIALPFSVRLLLGCDEERGMGDIPRYLAKHAPPRFSFTPDSDYPVCCGEKGIAVIEVKIPLETGGITAFEGGTVTNAVAGAARAELTTSAAAALSLDGAVLTANGRSAHAAMPENSVNAVKLLADALLACPEITGDSRRAMALASAWLSGFKGEGANMETDRGPTGFLTMICGLASLSGGVFTLNCNIRYPSDADFEGLLARAKLRAAELGATLTLVSNSPGYYKDPNSPEIRALTKAYETVAGVSAPPYVTGGGTYARTMPGTVAFGIDCKTPRDMFGEGRGAVHQKDEYIPKEELALAVEVFIHGLLNLAEI